jgi:hypothetical protein
MRADGHTLQAHLRNKSAKEPSAKESGTAQWPLARPSGCRLFDMSKAPDTNGKEAI